MTALKQAFASGVIAAVLAASCATAPQPSVPRDATRADILSAIPDPQMREMWRAAIDEGRTPPLSSLRVPEAPVVQRVRPSVRGASIAPQAPTLAPGSAPDVKIAAGLSADYSGPARVVAIEQNRVRLAVDGQTASVDILYRTPSGGPLRGISEGSDASLSIVHPVTDAPRMDSELLLADRGEYPVLLYLSLGAQKPITRRYASLAIRQLETQSGRAKAPSARNLPVRLAIDGEELTVRPGEQPTIFGAHGKYEAVVFHSRGQDPLTDSDGAPYELRLAIYRVN